MNPPPPSGRESESLSRADTSAEPAGHPPVRLPVAARGVGIFILATVGLVWLLSWAQIFFVSLLLGILIAYTLNPLVNGLQRIRLPRFVATTVVMVSVLCALAFGAYSLRGQAQNVINQLPAASSKISAKLASLRYSQRRTMQKVRSAARVFEGVTKSTTVTVTPPPTLPPPPKPKPKADPEPQPEPTASSDAIVDPVVNPDVDSRPDPASEPEPEPEPAPAPAPLTPVQVLVEQPSNQLGGYLWAGSVGVVGFLAQATMVIFLVFFLLLNGDTFKRKLVRIAGPSLSNRKITVSILDDINRSIQRYMLMLLTTNVMVGLLSWAAFRLIGLDNAGAWAVLAGVLHVIPYLGPAVAAAATGMAGLLQFDSLSTAALVAGASLFVATLIGTFVTAWMTGRIAKMNTAGVFVSLLFWGWLWGLWGMLLSIPIIVIIKVISQQVEQLHPVAELLGE